MKIESVWKLKHLLDERIMLENLSNLTDNDSDYVIFQFKGKDIPNELSLPMAKLLTPIVNNYVEDLDDKIQKTINHMAHEK